MDYTAIIDRRQLTFRLFGLLLLVTGLTAFVYLLMEVAL